MSVASGTSLTTGHVSCYRNQVFVFSNAPVCCLVQPPSFSFVWLREKGHLKFSTLPWSVVGAPKRSEFWSSRGTFCGPRIFAPSPARSGSGCWTGLVGVHRTLFGFELAYGTSGCSATSCLENRAGATRAADCCRKSTEKTMRETRMVSEGNQKSVLQFAPLYARMKAAWAGWIGVPTAK